ncbi:MAG: hypothetical protein Q4B26_12475 [Eubacteriales bacterium]|nr:hypothetical protein [Eubacteriales bacterium]
MSKSGDGTITIDTNVNTAGIQTGTRNIESSIGTLKSRVSGLGKTIAAAFTVKKIVDFGRECTNLAAAQQEAENKLETVMKQRMHATDDMIDSIKQLASEQQKLGVIGDETQLAGAQQLATFLNSTEALKTLVPAMNNLAAQQKGVNASAGDMVNIGNLMGKVMQGQVSALTRVGITFSDAEEKVLKFGTEEQKAAMLAQVITNNVGNMNAALAATPAGQMKQLKNNLSDVMETVGMGLQNFMLPLLQVINKLVARLATLANAFKSFSELITGRKSTETAASGIASTDSLATAADSYNDTANAIENVANATDDATKATTAAAKAAKKYLSPLDEIHKIGADTSTTSAGSGSPSATGGGLGDAVDYGALAEGTTVLDETINKVSKLQKFLQNLFRLYKKGLVQGLGEWKRKISSMQTSLESIKTSLIGIATDPQVVSSARRMLTSFATALGQVTGSFVRIGLTIADNLVGGIASYLEDSQDYIAGKLSDIFDIRADIYALVGEYSVAFANVFDIFSSSEAQNLTGNVIGIFSDAFLGAQAVVERITRDIATLILQPFIDNQENIKQVLSVYVSTFESVTGTMKQAVQEVTDKFLAMYDEHIAPFVADLTEDISEITGILTENWNTYIAPIIQNTGDKVQELWDKHLSPMFDSAGECLGTIVDSISKLWKSVLAPCIKWISANVLPVISPILSTLQTSIFGFFGGVGQVVNGILQHLSGLIKFITGVFTGDWSGAWEGIKQMFQGFGTSFGGVIEWLKNSQLGQLISWIAGTFTSDWSNVWENVKSIFSDVFDSLIELAKGPINSVIGLINGLIEKINGRLGWIENTMKFSVGGTIPIINRRWSYTSPSLHLGRVNTIPYLAKGAVIPPNSEFMAMLGDQKAGRNLEAPESLIRQIMREELGNNTGGKSTYEVPIYLGTREIARAVIDEAKLMRIQSGRNPFELV